MISEVHNMDCMELMRQYPDKHFDLAVVDPPYGIKRAKTQTITDKYVSNGKGQNFKIKNYVQKEWDNNSPNDKYFKELFRISKNQIIWGANYFTQNLPPLKNFIYWHKKGKSKDTIFNEGELAYVSVGRNRMIDIWWNGVGVVHSKEARFHPTQKPVALYDWIFKNYAKEGQLILDTHLGSGSSRIAADKAGLNFVGCELDADYFAAHEKRWNEYKMQLKLL